jgi:cardiolipin synthase (CMP-forming)
MWLQLPNALSISRIVLGAIAIAISGELTRLRFLATVGILIASLLTDIVDGYLARRWKITSDVGYILDSLGDRSVHLAYVLIFLVRYGYYPLFAWLVIFRDISIFAIRVLASEWLSKSKRLQWLSRIQSVFLRLWIVLFLVRDGFRVFTGSDTLSTPGFNGLQMVLLCTAIALAYYGLAQSVKWLIDLDHKTLT